MGNYIKMAGELDRRVKHHKPQPGETKPDNMYVSNPKLVSEMKPAEHTSKIHDTFQTIFLNISKNYTVTMNGLEKKKKKMDKEDKIPVVHWDEVNQLLPDSIPPDPLPAFYAYFHMLRIYYWLVEGERGMYVTYGLFERINDFINTLAFRMNLEVKQLLIDNYEISFKRRSNSM